MQFSSQEHLHVWLCHSKQDLCQLVANGEVFPNCKISRLKYNKDIDKLLLHFQHIYRGIHCNSKILQRYIAQNIEGITGFVGSEKPRLK